MLGFPDADPAAGPDQNLEAFTGTQDDVSLNSFLFPNINANGIYTPPVSVVNESKNSYDASSNNYLSGYKDVASELINGLPAFTGTDISVYIHIPSSNSKYNKLGSLKLLSWGTQRNKSMVTSLGKAEGVGYTRGVRIVTGAMEFLQLDRSAFSVVIDKNIKRSKNNVYKYTTMPDELPPFDLLISYVNEQGDASYRIIKHVEIVASQGTDSIDTTNPTEVYSFVALSVTPLIPLDVMINKSKEGYVPNNIVSIVEAKSKNPTKIDKSFDIQNPFDLNPVFNSTASKVFGTKPDVIGYINKSLVLGPGN